MNDFNHYFGACVALTAEVAKLKGELAAAKSHEKKMDVATQALMQEVTKLRNELAAMTERAYKAEMANSSLAGASALRIDRAECERDAALAQAAKLAGLLRAKAVEWQDRSDTMPHGGYHEASAANMAEADALAECADAINAALAEYDAQVQRLVGCEPKNGEKS